MEKLGYCENMAEGLEQKEEGGWRLRLNRRNFLTALGGAVIMSLFSGPLGEFGRPNEARQKAENLWETYERNPEGFRKEYPHNIEENLVAGARGVNLREVPSARAGREGIVGYLNPNEPVGIALVHPDIKPDPVNGSFLAIKKNNQVYFVARRELVDPNLDTIVEVINKP